MSAATKAAPSPSSDSAPTRDCPEPTMSVSGNSRSGEISRPEFLHGAQTKREIADRICDELLEQGMRFDSFSNQAYLLADAIGYQVACEGRSSLIFASDARGALVGGDQKQLLEQLGEKFGSRQIKIEKLCDELAKGGDLHAKARSTSHSILAMIIHLERETAEIETLVLARSKEHAMSYVEERERAHGEAEGNAKIHTVDLFSQAENAPEVRMLSDLGDDLFDSTEWLRVLRNQLDRAFPSSK